MIHSTHRIIARLGPNGKFNFRIYEVFFDYVEWKIISWNPAPVNLETESENDPISLRRSAEYMQQIIWAASQPILVEREGQLESLEDRPPTDYKDWKRYNAKGMRAEISYSLLGGLFLHFCDRSTGKFFDCDLYTPDFAVVIDDDDCVIYQHKEQPEKCFLDFSMATLGYADERAEDCPPGEVLLKDASSD